VNLHHLWPQTYAAAIKGAAVPSKLKKYKKSVHLSQKSMLLMGLALKAGQ